MQYVTATIAQERRPFFRKSALAVLIALGALTIAACSTQPAEQTRLCCDNLRPVYGFHCSARV